MVANVSTWVGLILATTLPPGAETKSLIAQLGSPRFAEREAASEALERLGQDAFPILREARKDRDPEIKNRAEVLLDAIEKTMLTRPTSITLRGGSQSISRWIDEISRAQGIAIPMDEDGEPGTGLPAGIKPATLPFWQALDALNLVAKWEPDAEPDRFGNRRDSSFRLAFRHGAVPAVSDSGPFRIAIAKAPGFGAEVQKMEGFPPIGGNLARRDGQELIVPLEILAEPRLGIRITGPIKIHEAVDDQGQTLSPSPRNGEFDNNNSGPSAEPLGSKIATTLRLRSTARRGKFLTTLRGSIPIEVESRRIEPTVIPVDGIGPGDRKPFAASGFTLLVHGVVPQRQQFGVFGGGIALEVTLRPDGWVGPMGRGGGRRNQVWGEQINNDEEKFLRALEVVDSEGRRFRTEPKPMGGGADGKHFVLDLTPPRGVVSGQPTEVRYYGHGRTPYEIPFQFKNVPMP